MNTLASKVIWITNKKEAQEKEKEARKEIRSKREKKKQEKRKKQEKKKKTQKKFSEKRGNDDKNKLKPSRNDGGQKSVNSSEYQAQVSVCS